MPVAAPLLALLSLPGPAIPQEDAGGGLTSLEREAGWRSLAAPGLWRASGGAEWPEGWELADGVLRRVGPGGDLVTRESFGDLELELEWRVGPGGDSGVEARVDEELGPVGLELQLEDDTGHADGAVPAHRSGALHDLLPPAADAPPCAPDAWHSLRLVLDRGRGEHWLDGRRVLVYDLGSDAFRAALAASELASLERFPPERGPLLLQDHGDPVAFRRMRVRALDDLPGERVELFDGRTLAGWDEVGDARYGPDQGAILGEVEGGSQSFLCTRRSFGDFLFTVDVRIEGPGNSGIQVRSHREPGGRVQGYQIEIDPSERAWSGGLYDEARRGWLQDLEENEPGRRALDLEGWNRYRIECVGPWIRAWVNGVPTTDWIDPVDLEGFLALQVHSGRGTRVRWANLELRDLGTRRWVEAPATEPDGDGWRLLAADADDFAVRLRAAEGGGELAFRSALDGAAPELLDATRGDAPPTRLGASSWRLDLGTLEGSGAGERDVVVCSYGTRLTVHVDGRLAGRFERARAASGALRLADPERRVASIELLSEPGPR